MHVVQPRRALELNKQISQGFPQGYPELKSS